MDWKDAAARVVIAGCEPHPEDVALVLGWSDGLVARTLAETMREVVVVDPGEAPELPDRVRWVRGEDPVAVEGLSVVAAHWTFRQRPPHEQRALVGKVARILPERGLFVVGDVMWSLPYEMIDEPEQYGSDVTHAPEVAKVEQWARDAGFLPDVHRFGPGVAVLIAIKAGK
jgi:hypothetical protein